MSMGSLKENIQKRFFLPTNPMKDELPISQGLNNEQTSLNGLRRRLSSFSVNIQPFSSSVATSWTALRRSTSEPEFIGELSGGPLRRFWHNSFGWLFAKKPAAYPNDLAMNEAATAMRGWSTRGILRHLFYKIRAEIRRRVNFEMLPTKHEFRYDYVSYAQNFDEGK
ncbi:hypothetical protein HPP92_019672 [Vanilla planifolia]|uniref:Uncharacterized protein n=1 Tax=Vanilla planifolia TaxID=51239 RepID=A0A835Q2Q9_VANPL|nr:hypothetical protein HPP92_019672 [Vanilla planifolia]